MRSAVILLTFSSVLLVGAAARASAPVDPVAADAAFDALMATQSQLLAAHRVAPPRPWSEPDLATAARIDVSHRTFDALHQLAVASAEARSTPGQGPALVLGASHYRGEAIDGALHLELDLDVTLTREGAWKLVPLIGQGALLVSAEVDGEPIGVVTRHGYQVWPTTRTGQVRISMRLLVPPTGPRGSIEYDFVAPRTPVTRFVCRFPVPGLEPRVGLAVRADVASDAESTLLTATLQPTTRVHLVGFRDLGLDADTPARVYADGLHLLSVDDDALEVFSELRYTILYAGSKRFDVLVPAGATVLSAEGHGALHYELVPVEGGATLIRGETTSPIRDAYAISVRLRRDLPPPGEPFDAPLPRPVGAERATGWLAVEVPGKLQVEAISHTSGATPVDVRQLPSELVGSAVSPILHAYRLDRREAEATLRATRLPERATASDTIDHAHAVTVMASDGIASTELTLRLRNRLRPSLSLRLPAGAEVRSVLLDGAPARPSRDDAGRLVLPLARSAQATRGLAPVRLQIVYQERHDSLGWLGRLALALPEVELPISELRWSLHLPGDHRYGQPTGGVPHAHWGHGQWTRAASPEPAVASAPLRDGAGLDAMAPLSAETGAMPVRVAVPIAGTHRTLRRHWVDADARVTTEVSYVRDAIVLPTALILALLALLGGLLLGAGAARPPRRLLIGAGAVVGALGVSPLVAMGHPGLAALAIAVAALVSATRRGLVRTWRAGIVDGTARLRAAYRDREVDLSRRSERYRVLRVAVTVATLALIALAAVEGLALLGRWL